MKYFLTILFIWVFALAHAQETNQFDSNGKRHGKWMKFYEGTDEIRYRGTFEHGKEIGTFEFYKFPEERKPNSKSFLFATKTYTKNSDLIEIAYFTEKGDLVSNGQMKGKDRVGKWVYFHPGTDKILMTELYENGKLNGFQTTFFLNGNVMKKSFYKNGKLEGKEFIYTENGILVKQFTYENNELNGIVNYYDAEGNLTTTGFYKNNRKDGEWKTYENGKVVKTEIFPLH
ncbi:MAG TPA: hypothetical protein VFM82_07290 [Flavobacteriaceae bacterium]|nr:hypothetical protein [Flavobacteriaceae bacterium]